MAYSFCFVSVWSLIEFPFIYYMLYAESNTWSSFTIGDSPDAAIDFRERLVTSYAYIP